MTDKPILPPRAPRPTSVASGQLCLLGWWNPTQVTVLRKWPLD